MDFTSGLSLTSGAVPPGDRTPIPEPRQRIPNTKWIGIEPQRCRRKLCKWTKLKGHSHLIILKGHCHLIILKGHSHLIILKGHSHLIILKGHCHLNMFSLSSSNVLFYIFLTDLGKNVTVFLWIK